jgi:hypothetical protein
MKMCNALLALACSSLTSLSCQADCNPTFEHGSGGLTSGRLVYQSRDTQSVEDPSTLYLYDFSQKQRQILSWPGLSRARNAHFSTGGQWIVFTAVFRADRGNPFNIFAAKLGGFRANNLSRLTHAADQRSEDANFSFDGSLIVYKKTGDLWIMRVVLHDDGTVEVSENVQLTTGGADDGSYREASAPFLAVGNDYIVFFRGGGANYPEQLYVLPMDPNTLMPGTEFPISKDLDAWEYYPVLTESGALYYARHLNSDLHDQIWLRSPNYSFDPVHLPTNDCSAENADPAPVQGNRFIFSYKSGNSDVRYKLRLGDSATGKVWDFSNNHQLNHTRWDLQGASYTPR